MARQAPSEICGGEHGEREVSGEMIYAQVPWWVVGCMGCLLAGLVIGWLARCAAEQGGM